MILIKNNISKKIDIKCRPSCLIMGRIGDGKTTLANMICGTDHISDVGKGSLTRQLYKNAASFGDDQFDVIDTPGTESNEDTFKHAYLLFKGLTTKELNTIFLVIKYETRYSLMVDRYEKTIKPIFNYEKRVVILVSHMDLAKNPQLEFKNICEEFKEIDVNIIFYSKDVDRTNLSNKMYACMSNMESSLIEISDIDFYSKFDLASIPKIRKMRRSFEECINQMQNISKSFSDTLASHNTIEAEEKDEWLHSLSVSQSEYLNKLLEKYQQEFKNEMIDCDFYLFSIQMQSNIIAKEEEFLKKIRTVMSYDLLDKKDPRNLIKMCPNCKEIWVKTEGCDGETTCGNIPSKSEIFFGELKTKFRFFFDTTQPNKVMWEKPSKIDVKKLLDELELNLPLFEEKDKLKLVLLTFNELSAHYDILTLDEDRRLNSICNNFILMFENYKPEPLHNVDTGMYFFENFIKFLFKNLISDKQETGFDKMSKVYEILRNYNKIKSNVKSTPVGCGAKFVWKDQPPLRTDVLFQLYQVNTIEKVKELLNKDAVKKTLEKEKSDIDTDFYS